LRRFTVPIRRRRAGVTAPRSARASRSTRSRATPIRRISQRPTSNGPAKVVISQHPRRAQPLAIDAEIYKERHLIENFFCKLKEFKRIAMRSDKTDQSFAAMIYLTSAVINSR